MFLTLVGLDGRILNLNHVIMIEESEVTIDDQIQDGATITLINGDEIDVNSTDAELLFSRLDMMLQATDKMIEQALQPPQQIANG